MASKIRVEVQCEECQGYYMRKSGEPGYTCPVCLQDQQDEEDFKALNLAKVQSMKRIASQL
jgi:hypothetical protein